MGFIGDAVDALGDVAGDVVGGIGDAASWAGQGLLDVGLGRGVGAFLNPASWGLRQIGLGPEKLLPIAGGVVGSIIPGVGTALGAGLGSLAGQAVGAVDKMTDTSRPGAGGAKKAAAPSGGMMPNFVQSGGGMPSMEASLLPDAYTPLVSSQPSPSWSPPDFVQSAMSAAPPAGAPMAMPSTAPQGVPFSAASASAPTDISSIFAASGGEVQQPVYAFRQQNLAGGGPVQQATTTSAPALAPQQTTTAAPAPTIAPQPTSSNSGILGSTMQPAALLGVPNLTPGIAGAQGQYGSLSGMGTDFTNNMIGRSGQNNIDFGAANDTLNQLNTLASQLTAQGMGQGPNPALEQLRMTTEQNINQTQGQIASQKGMNPAMAGRLGAQAAGQMNQQAAGQSALQRAQQTLASQQAAGNVLGSMSGLQANMAQAQAGNQLNWGQLGSNQLLGLGQNALMNQGQLLNALAQYNATGAEGQNKANQYNALFGQNLVGGGLNAAGNALGQLGITDKVKGWLNGGGGNSSISSLPDTTGGQDPNDWTAVGPATAAGDAGADPNDWTTDTGADPNDWYNPSDWSGAEGGTVPSLDEPAEEEDEAESGPYPMPMYDHAPPSEEDYGFWDPLYAAHGLPLAFILGGHVPGVPQYAGDTERNDVVDAKLSPGEIVLPNSVTQDPNPEQAAAEFVAAIKAQKGRKGPTGYARVVATRG